MTEAPRPRRAFNPDDDVPSPEPMSSPQNDPEATVERPDLGLGSPDWFRAPSTSSGPDPSTGSGTDGTEEGVSQGTDGTDHVVDAAALSLFRDPPAPGHGGAHAQPASLAESQRRAHLRTSLGLTAASTVLPGVGLLGAKPIGLKLLGALTSLATLGGLGYLAYRALTDPNILGAVANPAYLPVISGAAIAIGLVWVLLILVTHLATRPQGLSGGKRLVSAMLVTSLTFLVAAPTAVGARYASDASAALNTAMKKREDITANGQVTLAPPEVAVDPWQDVPRLNILLLGADGNKGREQMVEQFGIRTDTIMVASINTATGDTILIQIPRNVPTTPFPEGSEMDKEFPRGFRGEPAADWMVNGIWAEVELNRPHVLEGKTFRGAEALKQGIQGITGLEINYFLMLDTDGLSELVDAMGGVTVNINERIPIGGNTDKKIPPSGWLEVEKDAHLDGVDALWFARGRYGSDDYHRMARQSCLVDAIIKQANPTNLLSRFEAIAYAGAKMIQTDIPQEDLSAMITLALRVKDASTTRVVFTPGLNGYSSSNPDYDAMHAAVAAAVDASDNPASPAPATSAPAATGSATSTATSSSADPSAPVTNEAGVAEGNQDVANACAWRGDTEEE